MELLAILSFTHEAQSLRTAITGIQPRQLKSRAVCIVLKVFLLQWQGQTGSLGSCGHQRTHSTSPV